jgi:hypothetical protein
MRFLLGNVIVFAACALTSFPGCIGGGCYATQENFRVTPAESCIEPVYDVCDAEAGTMTVRNNCSDPLVVLNNSGGDSGVGGTSQADVTIAPGAKVEIDCAPFTNSSNSGLWHVTIPAVLGTTSVTITFDIAR